VTRAELGSAAPQEISSLDQYSAPAPRPRSGSGSWTCFWTQSWATTILAAAAGVLLVGLSYRLSVEGRPADLYYATFWAGMLPAVLLVGRRIAAREGTRAGRLWAVALLGAVTAAPKYLRNPYAPSYHDEYAHWREAIDVLADGRLFHPNSLIPIIQFFPGTSGLTAVVARLTGLSAWSAGMLVLFAAHLLALFAMFVAGEAYLGSARAGAIAALIYELNPSAMYFDTQFAYEGLAVALFLWVIALTGLATREDNRRRRTGLTAAAVLCAVGSVVTHHLTTIFLLLFLFCTAVAVTARPWLSRRAGHDAFRIEPPCDHSRQVWWTITASTAAAAAAWLLYVARPTINYLSPYFSGSVGQLSSMATDPASGRTMLATSAQPLWERGLTALAPLLVGLLCLRGLLVLRRQWREWNSDVLALMALGLIYFPSVLFLFAPLGAEGARRSWAFSYVGLALLGAYVVVGCSWPAVKRIPGRWRSAPGLVALAVVLIGNVGAGMNDPYRFPGPFRWGTDTTSTSAEARTVAVRMAAEVGPVRVVTDRYTALQLTAYGGMHAAAPSAGFPVWELVQKGNDPSSALAGMLVSSDYNYLVVDVRMAQKAAFNGDDYGPGDLLAGRPTPLEYLDRLDHVRWASRILSTDHLRVYRLNLPLLADTVQGAR